MKKYLNIFYLTFVCLLGSKYLSIRRSCPDHPQRVVDDPSSESAGNSNPITTWLCKYMFGRSVVKKPACVEYKRFRTELFYGAHYQETLNRLLNLASFVPFIHLLIEWLVWVLFSNRNNTGLKEIPNFYLRDGSRQVIEPSFSVSKKMMVMVIMLLPLAGVAQEEQQGAGAPIVIYGEIHSPFEYNQLEVKLFENYLWHNPTQFDHYRDTIALKKGTMAQVNPKSQYMRWVSPEFNEPAYLSLKADNHYLIRDYLVMPGDSIMVFFDDFTKYTYFDGKAAPAFDLQYKQVREFQFEKFQEGITINTSDPNDLLYNQGFSMLLDEFGSQYGRQVRVIPYDKFYNLKSLHRKSEELEKEFRSTEKFSAESTDFQINIIHANRFGKELYGLYNLFRFDYANAVKRNDTDLQDSLVTFFRQKLPTPQDYPIPGNLIYYSSELPGAIVEYALVSSQIDSIDIGNWVKENYHGEVRDKLWAYYFLRHSQGIADPENWISEISKHVETPWISEIFKGYIANMETSSELEEYRFITPKGGQGGFADLERDRIVLVDFWFTGCGACVKFYRDVLSKLEEEYSGQGNIEFVSISIDGDPELWKKSLQSGKYTSPHATNYYAGPDHKILADFRISSFPNQLVLGPGLKILQSGGFPQSLEGWRNLINSNLISNPVN
ncbi:TlpA family protein disulfide reductase [Arthrospiribacter ruber]|uniref:Thioredoxin domain-containing protein n=1 Tax=Arthrospiribacter ruber TaxID=2487934 RepID=A0A951IWD7_9BACT|nr:thioredoxin family protein [Arthrospiribacter ruber]MBW3466863.1 hypothetical protein [Arthrospiribacter ruber]